MSNITNVSRVLADKFDLADEAFNRFSISGLYVSKSKKAAVLHCYRETREDLAIQPSDLAAAESLVAEGTRVVVQLQQGSGINRVFDFAEVMAAPRETVLVKNPGKGHEGSEGKPFILIKAAPLTKL